MMMFKHSYIRNKRRFIAGLLCAILVSFVVLSLSYIHKESHPHSHTEGEVCHICEFVDECQLTIRNYTGLAVVSVLLVFTSLYLVQVFEKTYLYLVSNSLIADKIRMNN